MKLSMNLKKTEDPYDFTEVGCSEKPFGIVLDAFCLGYSKGYYMALKLVQAYNLKNYQYNGQNLTSKYEAQKLILKDFIGVDLLMENVDASKIQEWIEHKIDCNCIPLVNGNLRELFYSKYYKKEDWSHLFLINGYNKKSGLFYIIDSSQAYREEHTAKFKPFVMEYEILYEIYRSGQGMLRDCACFIEGTQAEKMNNISKIILKCLNEYLRNTERQKYKEIDVIEHIITDSDSKGMDIYSEKVLGIRNAKKVFFNELVDFLKTFKIEVLDINEFECIKNNLLSEWQKAIYRILIKINRNKDVELETELTEVFIYEKKIFQKIQMIEQAFVCKWELLSSEGYNFKNLYKDEFENNEDSIIKHIGDKLYEFNFSSGKIYSSYGIDDSPKVILSRNILPNEHVLLKTELTISKYNEFSEFLAGIIIRTDNEGLYFWGNCCRESIRLDLSGIHNNIYEVPNAEDTIKLLVKVCNNHLVVGYVDKNNELIECYSTFPNEKILQVGIGCKTWGKTDSLVVRFNNTELTKNNLRE